jgi:hypothetical protein
MNSLAIAMICAIRYAHGRSLHTYVEVIEAIRETWAIWDGDSQRRFLALVRDQVPRDLGSRIAATRPDSCIPVSRRELDEELAAYELLFDWCQSRMGPETLARVGENDASLG